MKVAFLGTSASAKTGYGLITRNILQRLQPKYEVVSFAHEGDALIWGGQKMIPLGDGKEVLTLPYPNPQTDESAAAGWCDLYAKQHHIDLIIGFWDAFALGFMKRLHVPFCQYIPIDATYTKQWMSYSEDAMKVISYSKFGLNEISKWLEPSRVSYIPHAVDTEVFHPIAKKYNRKKDIREGLTPLITRPIPEDSFLLCMVGANYTDRKKLPLFMRTFAKFAKAKENADAYLYMHTNAKAWSMKGYSLEEHAKVLGIAERVIFPKYSPDQIPFSDEEMNRIYNASDVLVSNSSGEGFGMPILEAQSAGLPVIAPRNSSQTELVEGHGYLVDNISEEAYVDYPMYVTYGTWNPVPDQRSMLAAMNFAYDNPELRGLYGLDSREFVLENYDWDYVMRMWDELLSTVEDELSIWKSVLR